MSKRLEVGHVTVRSWLGLALVFCASIAGAQSPPRQHDADALKLLVVPAFNGDKTIACKAAMEVRDKIEDDLDGRHLWVVSRTNIEETLKASGFPVCDPITPSDAKQLSSQLRADAYVDGTISKVAALPAPANGPGIRLEAKLVLARGPEFAQPLPPAEGRDAGAVAKQVSKSLDAALKQIPGEDKCYKAAGQQQYAAALAAAQTAIAAYPQSTLARLCIANVYAAEKLPPDSIISATKPILALDPHNRRSLELVAQAYYDKKDFDNAVKAWTELIAGDPSNSELIEGIITKIVQSGHAQAALPIMKQVVEQNQGDPKLLELYYRLLIVTKTYKDALPIGEEVIKEDTAFADTLFWQRQTFAYSGDSNHVKAAETAARGLAKFPNNETLMLLQAQELYTAGQVAQAKALLLQILQKDPKNANAALILMNIYVQAGNPDSTLWAMHQAIAATVPAATVAPVALSQGNKYYRIGNNLSKTAPTAARDTLDVAIKFLSYSDSLVPDTRPKFLWGASAFVAGYAVAQEASKEKSCPLAKAAGDYFTATQTYAPAGLPDQTLHDPAVQILSGLQQLNPFVQKEVKAFCK
jgi:tetratricopeptide (TPR) repeat protein